jgi:tetratricopeptide (TPR) repeat protein
MEKGLITYIRIFTILSVLAILTVSCSSHGVKHNPVESAAEWFDMAQKAVEKGAYKKAMEYFREAEQRFSSAYENASSVIEDKTLKALLLSRYSQGNIYYFWGEYENAIERYNKALSNKPVSLDIHEIEAEVLAARGFSYFHIGKREEAIKDYQKAVRLNPEGDKVQTLGRALGF